MPQARVSVAGFKRIARFGAMSPMKAHGAIKRGVPAKTVDYLREGLDLSKESVAVLLGNVRTSQRLRITTERALDTNVAGRLYRISVVIKKAADLFRTPDVAVQMLKSEQRALNYRTPLSLMRTEPGALAVEDLLGRIAYGVYT